MHIIFVSLARVLFFQYLMEKRRGEGRKKRGKLRSENVTY